MIWLFNKALYIWKSGAIEIWFNQSTIDDIFLVCFEFDLKCKFCELLFEKKTSRVFCCCESRNDKNMK